MKFCPLYVFALLSLGCGTNVCHDRAAVPSNCEVLQRGAECQPDFLACTEDGGVACYWQQSRGALFSTRCPETRDAQVLDAADASFDVGSESPNGLDGEVVDTTVATMDAERDVMSRDVTLDPSSDARCQGDAGLENTVLLCSDGCSNDDDFFADCNDFDCCNVRSCPEGTACNRMRRDARVADVCETGVTNPETSLETCTNGCDDDRDGFADCDDFNCCGLVFCASGGCAGRDGSLGPDATQN